MSYQKTTWADGDIISAQRMNNIENGIENLSTNSGQTSFPVVFFNLEDIINQAKSEDGFRLSIFNNLIQQGKAIIIFYNNQNYQGTSFQGSTFAQITFLDYTTNLSYDNTWLYFKSYGLPENFTLVYDNIVLTLFFTDSDYLTSIDIKKWTYNPNQDASFSETLFSWPEQQLSQ